MAIGKVRSTQASIFSLRLGPNDHYSYDTGGSTTSTSFIDLNTLTFTPATTSDYVVFAFASVALNTTNRSITPRLYHDTAATAYNEHTLYQGNTYPKFSPWMAMQVFTGLTGEQTFKLQFRVETLNTGYWNFTQLVAVCLSDFPDYDYAESLAQSNTSSTSFVTKVSLTPTLVPNAPYVVFSNAWLRKTVNLGHHEARTIQDSVYIHSLTIPRPLYTAIDHTNHHSLRVFRPRTTSSTFEVQHRTQSLAGSAILSANILCIQLNDTASLQLNGNLKLNGNTRLR